MSRRALELGEHGEIEASPQMRDEAGKWKKAPTPRRADRWRARCYYRGYDGVMKEVCRFAATKRAAIQAVEAALAERERGHVEMTSGMKLTAAGELWLTHIRRTDSGLSARTVLDYGRTFTRYINAQGSSIRGLTLAQVNDPQRLRTFLQKVADNHGTGASKMSRSVLSGILGFAIDNGTLTTNALRQIRAVKAQTVKTPARERDTSRALTRDEREQVIAYADKLALAENINPRTRRKRETVADLMAFMAGSGVRINEARAVRWDDIDLKTGVVHIRGTKTRSSDRRLTLPVWVIERTRARAERLDTKGLVFGSPHHLNEPERVWDQSNSAKALARIFIGSGFPWATPHTLRRTVATILDQSGVPIATIADQLGHTDPAMTARVYLGRDLMGDKASVAAFL
ncbi:tyrosine-type recombinase/integrase [Actinoplanes sp. NPDC020271]|uniref:tyrosine-type recombinase/integrase n=1 Tax=Actinoplanes sp. NPDC020271 TaxID=3363896 RepID=UPI0037B01641